MKGLLPLAIALALATPAGAVSPRPGPGDPRNQVVDYDPMAVVEVQAVLGYQLSVEFDPLERIENVAIGDSLGWQVTPNRRANIIFLKPMAARPSTNMTVVTNLRRYSFQLSVRRSAHARSIPFSVTFLYPAPAMALIPAPPPEPPPQARNRDYSYEGSAKTLPVRVFDDGEATYFAFKEGEDLPAIYTLEADGSEAVVNSYQKQGFVVVSQVARGFVLRRGSEATKIFNDRYRVEEASSVRARPKQPWWRR